MTQTTDPLWRPSPDRVAATNANHFMAAVEAYWGVSLPVFADLYRFSIEEPEKFWVALRDFAGIIGGPWDGPVLVDADKMPGARWFPEAKINFAENLLRLRDDTDAMVFWGEDRVRRRLSHSDVYDRVARLAQALRAAGVGPGDRVGAYIPNMPEAAIALLATAAIGAVFSSCSPDFGVDGVLDRFGQIEPKVLIAADGYHYNGKTHDCLEKLKGIVDGLPSVGAAVVVPYVRDDPPLDGIRGGVLMDDFTAPFAAPSDGDDMAFERFPFNHPLVILYSSGTTGVPKCIVHGIGGSLLHHAREHLIHCDIMPGDRVFYFSTCGWMMWNWLVGTIAWGATLLLYDGSPFYPNSTVLFDFADAEGATLFGTSAKFIDAAAKAGAEPVRTHKLDTVRTITSTGSPLAPESFDYVYAKIKADVHLASISGGTDIMGCFVLGDPTAPVWRGEIQTRALGMAVEVFDDHGKPVSGGKGELVCTNPFPSMPVKFWNDPGDEKYRAAYFEKYPGVWCHGDWVEITEHDGLIIHGRSDATLNPGGVRIGTAEIYRQVEKLDEVVEAIVVGQQWEGDVRVVLFVVLRQGLSLDARLIDRICSEIRTNCTRRHVPAKVIQVADIPRTKSGKIIELAVRDVIHGRDIPNTDALANPEALALYRDIPALKD